MLLRHTVMRQAPVHSTCRGTLSSSFGSPHRSYRCCLSAVFPCLESNTQGKQVHWIITMNKLHSQIDKCPTSIGQVCSHEQTLIGVQLGQLSMFGRLASASLASQQSWLLQLLTGNVEFSLFLRRLLQAWLHHLPPKASFKYCMDSRLSCFCQIWLAVLNLIWWLMFKLWAVRGYTSK